MIVPQPPIPLAVNFHLWPRCNLRCTFCFAGFPESRGRIPTRDAATTRSGARAMDHHSGITSEHRRRRGRDTPGHRDATPLLPTRRKAGTAWPRWRRRGRDSGGITKLLADSRAKGQPTLVRVG